MTNITVIAGGVVALAVLWLIGLAALSVFAPQKATQFLSSFASSARAHFLEHGLRIVAGSGFILYAPETRYTEMFRAFGWILVITSVLMLIMPWQWHQRFARWVVPIVNRHLKIYGLGALMLAGLIIYAML